MQYLYIVSVLIIFFKDQQIQKLKMNSKLIVFIVCCILSVCHLSCDAAESPATDGLSWSCVNNASCIKALSDEVLQKLRDRKPVQLGGITVEPLADDVVADPSAFSSARSMSFSDILSGNAITVPLGPMLLSLQRSDEYKNYLELALLRKASEGKKIY